MTHKENTQHGLKAGTIKCVPKKTHCKNGHLLAETQFFYKSGARQCSICYQIYIKAYRIKRREYIRSIKAKELLGE